MKMKVLDSFDDGKLRKFLIVSLFSLSKSAESEKDLRKCDQDWTFEIFYNTEWEKPCKVVRYR